MDKHRGLDVELGAHLGVIEVRLLPRLRRTAEETGDLNYGPI